MTCLKITESQNGQIYPEDTFSHGAAHVYFTENEVNYAEPVVGFIILCFTRLVTQVWIKTNFQRRIKNIFLPIAFSICFGCSKEPSH